MTSCQPMNGAVCRRRRAASVSIHVGHSEPAQRVIKVIPKAAMTRRALKDAQSGRSPANRQPHIEGRITASTGPPSHFDQRLIDNAFTFKLTKYHIRDNCVRITTVKKRKRKRKKKSKCPQAKCPMSSSFPSIIVSRLAVIMMGIFRLLHRFL